MAVKPKKNPDDPDYQKSFKYSIFVKGLKQDSITLTDTFDTALLEVVNAALAEFYESGVYGEWYQEALDIAASEGAIEVSVEDAA